MAVIGYIRVSSDKQTVEHQRHEILVFAQKDNMTIDKWVQETISSRQPLTKRRLGQLLQELQSGDILITAEISRLGRSLLEIMRILENCLNKDCQVWTIKENYRLGKDIQSKVMAFAFGLSAEIERNLISQRTKASLDNIRASGKKLGRPRMSKLSKKANIRKIRKMVNAGIDNATIAKCMNVHLTTLRRFLGQMNYECKSHE